MNMGNKAMACSGLACFSNTACAAAQQRSSVSVSSMAASRMLGGICFSISSFRSNGFLAFMGRSFPFGGGWYFHCTGLGRPAFQPAEQGVGNA